MLEWNVWYENVNERKIEPYNVFKHYRFVEDCRKAAKKFAKDESGFSEAVKSSLMYYFWSKCEWEVIITSWPPGKKDAQGRDYDIKIDVYDQVMMNFDKFIDYLWNNRGQLKEG